MSKKFSILAAIDNSNYCDEILKFIIFFNKKFKNFKEINNNILNIQIPHAQRNYENDDFSGSIGFNSNKTLLKKLTEIDEAESKLEVQKGELILNHAKSVLKENNINSKTTHLRGGVIEIISQLQEKNDLVIIGKRGSSQDLSKNHLGSNLNRIIREVKKPTLIITKKFSKIKSFVIAFDGGMNSLKIINYVKNSEFLKEFNCHLIKVGGNSEDLLKAEKELKDSGFNTQSKHCDGEIDEEILKYINEKNIDLLVMGAYSHSKITTFFIGSTTESMLKLLNLPILIVK